MQNETESVLPQHELISAVRRVCKQDERLVAALMYGSFIRGEGDACSDVEFVLYFKDELLPLVDKKCWVEQVAPVELFLFDGSANWVAIFHNLVRGEFHFEPASKMAEVRTWGLYSWAASIEAMRILDRTGELTDHLGCVVGSAPQRAAPEYLQELSGQFFNRILFGTDVLTRGERARAMDHLSHLHRNLQWLARLVENKMEHFPSPAKSFETDISPLAYQRFEKCVAGLEAGSLERAYWYGWQWGKELLVKLKAQHGLPLPETLLEKIDLRLSSWFQPYIQEE